KQRRAERIDRAVEQRRAKGAAGKDRAEMTEGEGAECTAFVELMQAGIGEKHEGRKDADREQHDEQHDRGRKATRAQSPINPEWEGRGHVSNRFAAMSRGRCGAVPLPPRSGGEGSGVGAPASALKTARSL